MRKITIFLMAVVVACSAAMAADVDFAAAQNAARSFMTKQVANGRLKAAAASNLKLAKAEASVFNPNAVDYYIFNADKSYVVVAGDDLAPEILMYGEEGAIDMDNIPPAMQWLLNKYKYQIDGLKAGTLKANGYTPKATTAVPPMVTANWDQSAPYNNQCPTSGSRRAVTGCPATSLAMCYYKWKWPKTYPAAAAINGSSSGGYSVAAIGERAADWNNIIDEYTGPSNYSSTSAQKDAVAWLMRYAGQTIPDYMYGYDASGATDPEILQGVKNMGYTGAQLLTLTAGRPGYNQSYTDTQWNTLMLAELHAGRPIEYLASDPNAGGHAFNVFGCDSNGKYYVNWGWSGDGNGYCTLHNFTASTGSTGQSGSFVFNYGEAMIIGIEPPASAFAPSIDIEVSSVTLTPGKTQVIPITGTNLTNNVTVTLTDPNNAFTLSVDGVNQTLNATPKSSGSITIPVASINDKTVNVRLTAKSGIEGEFNGSLSFASQGADTKTVSIKATSDDGGTASDAYLDIAKYATIDAAGWNSTDYVDNLYKYTEDLPNEVAWLTLPVYGAWSSVYYSPKAQKWINTNYNQSPGTNAMGSATWSASSPLLGSSVYFTNTTARYFGNTSNRASGLRTISFNVKNVTEIRLLGKNNSNNNLTTNNRCSVNVYECTDNGNGITVAPTAVKTANGGTNSTANINLTINDLDETKIYQVVVSTTRTQIYEIAFQTPLNKPTLAVNPEELYISAEPNSSATATFNVKGKLLENPVTVTLADANGVFSVSPTSISIANAEASTGSDVTVTFTPQNTGNFTGTVTLTSGTLSKTVTLNGTCAEKGTAQGNYLDIAKYATVGEPAGWYSESYANPYKYTVYPNEGSAWLTVPASIAYIGYDEGNQGWVGLNQYGNPYWYGHQWSATDVFAGHEYFKCDELTDADGDYAFMLGADVASSSVNTNTDMFYGMYFVTNCTQVKSYGFNNSGAGSNYPSFIMIYEMTEGADGTLTQAEDAFDVKANSTANTQYILTSAELDPEKIYFVAVGGYRGFVYEVSFRTPMEGLPGVPEIVSAVPTATTADITWTPGENNESWNLRYREYLDPEDATVFFDDFENGLGNWTIYTDGTAPQTNGWYAFDPSTSDLDVVPVSGSYVASAWSWSTNAYNANNWLITPQVTFGKVLTFWVRTNNGWPDSYEVLLSTTGNAERNFNVTLQAMAEAPNNGQWNLVSIDLSDYVGQTGYIAIHHVSEDCNYLLIDDFGIYNELAGEWIEVNNVTSPYTIEGLTPETTYEVQVQGVGDGGATSAWTPSTLFTTLGIEDATLAYIEGEGTPGTTYAIADPYLVAVDTRDVTVDNVDYVYVWCKDVAQSNDYVEVPTSPDIIDFMKDQRAQTGDWDQSNWVVLRFKNDATAHELKGCKVTNIVGTYADNNNYIIDVVSCDKGESKSYTPNVYCVANFNPEYIANNGIVTMNDKTYFFMVPKVQEVCKITFAEWTGTTFIVPQTSGFQGSLNLGWTYNIVNGRPAGLADLTNMVVGDIYEFNSIAQRQSRPLHGAPGLKDETGNSIVYPMDLAGSDNVVTAIYTVGMSKEVKSVKYYNPAGIESSKPFQGVNIVVTRYTDGSVTTTKVVK